MSWEGSGEEVPEQRRWTTAVHLSDRAVPATLAAVAWVFFSALALIRHYGLGSQFDSALIANVLWRLAHDFDDVTAMTGMHHFGDHASPILLVFVPVFRLTAEVGLPVLLVFQCLSVVLAAWAVWLLAGYLGIDSGPRLWLMAMGLLGVGSWMAALSDFHAVTLGLGPLAMLVAVAVRGCRGTTIVVWGLLASLARVEMAFAVATAGVVLIWSGYRRGGLAALWTGSAISLGLGLWMILTPWAGTSSSVHFQHLGVGSVRELPAAFLAGPADALSQLTAPLMLVSLAIWAVSYGMLPLLSWRWNLIAVPLIAIPMLGSWSYADAVWEHYWQILIPVFGVGSAFTVARYPWARSRVGAICGLALLTGWAMAGPVVFGLGSRPAMSLYRGSVDENRVLRYVDQWPSASLAAPGRLLAHLADREILYMTPEPFACPDPTIAAFAPAYGNPDIVITEEARDGNDSHADVTVIAGSYRLIRQIGRYGVFTKGQGIDAAEVAMTRCSPARGVP